MGTIDEAGAGGSSVGSGRAISLADWNTARRRAPRRSATIAPTGRSRAIPRNGRASRSPARLKTCGGNSREDGARLLLNDFHRLDLDVLIKFLDLVVKEFRQAPTAGSGACRWRKRYSYRQPATLFDERVGQLGRWIIRVKSIRWPGQFSPYRPQVQLRVRRWALAASGDRIAELPTLHPREVHGRSGRW